MDLDNSLNQVFDLITREHGQLLQNLKSSHDAKAEKEIQKQLALLQTLQNQILKLRNFRRDLEEKKSKF